MTQEIMGVNEVANYLNIKKQTVYRLLQDKKLPALKIGGQWKVKRDHLDKMFDEMLNEKLKEISNQQKVTSFYLKAPIFIGAFLLYTILYSN